MEERARERIRNNKLMHEISKKKAERLIPLRRLLALREYPPDIIAFYAQGASLTRYLVGLKGRCKVLAFVNDGMDLGWDAAVPRHYDHAGVAELEEGWLAWLGKDDPESP
jgi:hypothetical protein